MPDGVRGEVDDRSEDVAEGQNDEYHELLPFRCNIFRPWWSKSWRSGRVSPSWAKGPREARVGRQAYSIDMT